MVLTKTNIDAIRVYRSTWSQQIKDALTVNGGDVENATNSDYLLHFLSFGWKVHKIPTIHWDDMCSDSVLQERCLDHLS